MGAKVDLLPTETRKPSGIDFVTVILVIFIVAVAVGLYIFSERLKDQVNDLNRQVDKAKQEAASYNIYDAKKKEVLAQINALGVQSKATEELRKNPVIFSQALIVITQYIPNNVYLNSLSLTESGGNYGITVNGLITSNKANHPFYTVAQMLKDFLESPYFGTADLSGSITATEKQEKDSKAETLTTNVIIKTIYNKEVGEQ